MKDWQKRWREGKTAWDLGGVHPLTERLFDKALEDVKWPLADKHTALVPGCGRAHDAAYIAGLGYEVKAFDIVPEAIEAACSLYQNKQNLHLQVADVFEPEAADKGFYDLVFDRAVLCAFASSDQKAYVESCFQYLKSGGVFCTIPFTKINYSDTKQSGPPFEVSMDRLYDLLCDGFSLVYGEEFEVEAETESIIMCEALCVWRKKK